MPTFKNFTGINNVLQTERLGTKELRVASNVDIGMDNEVVRAKGYAVATAAHHKNLFNADGFLLATKSNGDLVNANTAAVLYASLGATPRVWYCNLPDGRTTFSNGLIAGIVTAAAATPWGVPIPATLGTAVDAVGDLHPGRYQYLLTYVRTSDGLEGGAAFSEPVEITTGGLAFMGLPALAGYTINVYITHANGTAGYYAGNTATSLFSFTGGPEDLVTPCDTEHCGPPPAGTLTAYYNGRVYVAEGNVLYASKHMRWELFDPEKDLKQFPSNITLLQPVDNGIWVGTTTELGFISGDTLDTMKYATVIESGAVLGSGVAVDGKYVRTGEGAGQGSAMVCICDRQLVAGFNSGEALRMSAGRYETAVTEVSAMFRVRDGIPQYIATTPA